MQRSLKMCLVAAGVTAWCATLVIGVRELHAYAIAPGARAATPATWPTASALPKGAVLMFLHAECPCSRASVAELATTIAAAGRPVAVTFVLSGEPHARLAEAMSAVTGAGRVLDAGGTEAARFGARTSGHVIVYDAQGVLAFSGGITSGRGHTGDNIGRRSLARVIAGDAPIDPQRGVFGCGLEPAR